MSTSFKTALGFAFTFLFVITLGSFYMAAGERKPQPWIFQLTTSTLALAVLAVLIWACTRKDSVPDLLRNLVKHPFEREGLCFAIVPVVHEGTCYLSVYFQNRYTGPVHAVITLKPAMQFWLNRRKVAAVSFRIACPRLGFGVTTIPWAVPAEYQGKVQTLEVGADVCYPMGLGQLVRHKDGRPVGSTSKDWSAIALEVGAVLTGHVECLGSSKPARFKFELPTGVREEIPEPTVLPVEILWEPGMEAEVSAETAPALPGQQDERI